MKIDKLLLGILVLFICLADTCFGAGDCTKMEYAEMKDMTKQQLARAFCSNSSSATIFSESAGRFKEIGELSRAVELYREAVACSEEAIRIERVLSSKYKTKGTKCNGPNPAGK